MATADADRGARARAGYLLHQYKCANVQALQFILLPHFDYLNFSHLSPASSPAPGAIGPDDCILPPCRARASRRRRVRVPAARTTSTSPTSARCRPQECSACSPSSL
jgi:hypothetical protein